MRGIIVQFMQQLPVSQSKSEVRMTKKACCALCGEFKQTLRASVREMCADILFAAKSVVVLSMNEHRSQHLYSEQEDVCNYKAH